jgi:hypothetical protein
MSAMQEGGVSGQGPGGSAVPLPAPAANPGPPPSADGQAGPDEPREEPRRGPIDFFRRLLRPQSRQPERDPSEDAEGPSGGGAEGRNGAEGPAAPGAAGPPGRQRQERPGARGAPEAATEQVTLSRAQLAEFVNGEVNRREARQKADAERARRRAQLESDPLGYADEERERLAVEEAQAAQRERMGQTLAYYDQHTMAPFLSSLPPDIVEQLRTETGGGVEGLEGRERLIARGRQLLEQRVRADERRKVLSGSNGRAASGGASSDPINRALRKQQLLREAESDGVPEPEVTGPGGGVAPQAEGPDMNTQLRNLLASRRTRS